MLHFVTSYMKQNRSRKQTLESAQNGLEIIFKLFNMHTNTIVYHHSGNCLALIPNKLEEEGKLNSFTPP